MLVINLIVTIFVCSSLSWARDKPRIFLENDTANPSSRNSCTDLDKRCSNWSQQGECQKNAAWMMSNCRKSCKSCQGGDKAWALRQHISDTYGNSTDDNGNNLTMNKVNINHLSIDHVEIEELNQVVQVHGRMVTEWNDTRVAWDTEKWGVSWLNFYYLQIWTPDIEQTDPPKGLASGATVERKMMAANYTGQVYMWSDFTFMIGCKFEYGSYPNDVQRCCAELDDRRFYAVRFNFLDKARKAATKSAMETHLAGWTIAEVKLTNHDYVVELLSDWKKDAFDLKSTNAEICLRLRRQTAAYGAQMVAPAVGTSVLTLVSFVVSGLGWWPQIGVLCVSVALQILSIGAMSMRLPTAMLDTPAVVSYASFNMAMTLIALITSLLLRRLCAYRTNTPPPHFVNVLLSAAEKIPCFGADPNSNNDDVDKIANGIDATSTASNGKRLWSPVAYLINNVLFVLMLVIYCAMMAASFLL